MTSTQAWLVALGVAVGAMSVLWLISARLRNASIIDPAWGPAFLLLSIVYLITSPEGADPVRSRLVLGAVALWSLRLGLHLVARSIGKPEDPRYRAMRDRNGPRWWLQSLFAVFWLQALLATVISVPLMVAIRSQAPPGWLDGLATIVFLAGLGIETVADWQLQRFRKNSELRGTVLDSGLWRYSRHPNYFGEALLWWGFWLFALPAGGVWTVFAPLLMTWLLTRVSGVPLLEAQLVETRPGYAEYLERTSSFIPWPPRRS